MPQSAAYNLNDFVAREPRRRPPLYVAPTVKRRRGISRYSMKAIQVIVFTTLFLTLVCGLLYLQMTVTELSAQIEGQQEELVNLNSEYTYLSSQLEMKTSLKNVQEYASTRLGLVKMDPSQVVYVQRDTGSIIERKQGMFERLFGAASRSTMSVISGLSEYNPPAQ